MSFEQTSPNTISTQDESSKGSDLLAKLSQEKNGVGPVEASRSTNNEFLESISEDLESLEGMQKELEVLQSISEIQRKQLENLTQQLNLLESAEKSSEAKKDQENDPSSDKKYT